MLRQLRNADEERFDAHVREFKERLAALDDAIHAPAPPPAECDTTLMDVVGRMDALQGQISALDRRVAQVGPREEAVADGLKQIKAMLGGIYTRSLTRPGVDEHFKDIIVVRENGAKQIAGELEAVIAARVQVEAAVSEAVARLVSAIHEDMRVHAHHHHLQTSKSLKRKRSEEDEDAMGEDEVRDVVPMPKRRRIVRRVAGMFVRTATVATVGAVAAWTALAFA